MALTTVSPGLLDTTAQYYGFKNRLINGACVIDQRNAGASVTASAVNTVTYTLDRWNYYATQASKFTIQQNAGGVTPPAGFSNYLGATVGASANVSISSGDNFTITQTIEGFNVADLNWGTANATAVTLSFRVYSSLTGTFGGSIRQGIGSRSYPFTYIVSSANTWTSISITIPGDTSGTYNSTNGASIIVGFTLGAGSTGLSTAGAWVAGNFWGATGAINPITTNSATFYITGVQLEKGSTATSFDYRPYGTELQLCQRYYETGFTKIYVAGGTAVAIATSFKVQKRAAPTQTYSNSPGGMTTALPTSNEAITVDGFSAYRSSAEMAFSWVAAIEL